MVGRSSCANALVYLRVYDGSFADHFYLAVGPPGLDAYEVYQVKGFVPHFFSNYQIYCVQAG